MIAACPDCGARYRIDPAKLPAAGARLRCSRCQGVFGVNPNGTPAASGHVESPKTEPAAPASSSAESRGAAPAQVLIAHPEADLGKQLLDLLAARGVAAAVVQDGVEAILKVQRALPRLVVLDAALPKMFGFQVCELMKRNEQLRSIPVVLVGAIHDRDRYRRPPQEIYGADAYLERHELLEALPSLLDRFGVESGSKTPQSPTQAREPARSVAPTPTPTPARASAPPAPAAAKEDPELEAANRLARIIISDVILYNPEKFEAGLRSENVTETLAGELEEGITLFRQRVGSERFDAREMLCRELERQAGAKKGA